MKRITEHEMRQLILERARQEPECEGISGLGIYHVVEPGQLNWGISAVQNISGEAAFRVLRRIVRELAANYEIQWPAESFDLNAKATVIADVRENGVGEQILETTLLDAILWAKRQKPGFNYSIFLHEADEAPRPLLIEELQFLFQEVRSSPA